MDRDPDFDHWADDIRVRRARQTSRGWAVVGLAVAAWLLVVLTAAAVVLAMRMG